MKPAPEARSGYITPITIYVDDQIAEWLGQRGEETMATRPGVVLALVKAAYRADATPKKP